MTNDALAVSRTKRRTARPGAIAATATLMLLAAPSAFAHPGHAEPSSLGAGLLHPLTGLDHLLAMLAVGLWAGQIGGRARWLVPAAFVSAMVGGGLLARAGVALPGVEHGITASLLVIGLLVAMAARAAVPAAAVIVGAFACCHGYAHVAEMPAGASMTAYAGGFVAATAALHAVGLALGAGLTRARFPTFIRIAGAGVAAAGLLIMLMPRT